MPTAQIYIKREEESTWESFKKICEINGWKFSDKIMENVRNIVAIHSGGGSQTLLDNIDKPKTLPKYKTCRLSDKQFIKGEFYCKEYKTWYIVSACDNCKKYWLDKT